MDQIVVMKDGHISEVGSYKELLMNNEAFAEFLRYYLTNPENEEAISDSEGMFKVAVMTMADIDRAC